MPGTAAFSRWRQRIANHDIEFVSPCNAADLAALGDLYADAGGAGWTQSGNWTGNAAVESWYGITADSLGRVTELDLDRNGLAGELPASLGDLTAMTVLRIGGNALSGHLPVRLARVPLRVLVYADTQLCTPIEPSFRAWLDGVVSHTGTGTDCPPAAGARHPRNVLRSHRRTQLGKQSRVADRRPAWAVARGENRRFRAGAWAAAREQWPVRCYPARTMRAFFKAPYANVLDRVLQRMYHLRYPAMSIHVRKGAGRVARPDADGPERRSV